MNTEIRNRFKARFALSRSSLCLGSMALHVLQRGGGIKYLDNVAHSGKEIKRTDKKW